MLLNPKLKAFRSSKLLILFTICTAMFADGFIYGLVAPVIPFVLRDQKLVAESKLQLSTSLLIAAFSIADFFGAPLCACILFGVSQNVGMLLASRLLQGFSSSILYTVGLAVLVDTVKKEEVGQWMGTAMSCNNIGMIISPLVGGVVYDKSGKMSVFAIMIALGAFDILLRVLMKEGPRDVSVAVAADDPPSYQLEDSTFKSATSSTNGCDPTTPPTEKAPRRRLPGIISLLRSPRLLAALYGCFINECIVASLCAVLPLFVNSIFHWTALEAGLLFLTIAIPALAGPLAGALSDRLGARWVAVSGFLLTAPPLILLRLVNDDSKEHMILLCGLLALAGCTIIFFLSPLGAECSFVAEEYSKSQDYDMYASSFSLMNCSLAAAGLLGPLAAGGLEEAFGWKATTLALGVLCLSGAIPCALVTGSRQKSKIEEESDG
ncbi:major facilitator superfamily domain-containing protein [Clohesyomyces aquaticus]|uniref:Major facilitator superfamily domain-containing protein n=1 Tax=Clohesyomyces aquaticus TaxID=1231657 RepID=A0A1Y2A4F0_9PLEO|nr:major facilitator superfamily domain-containing protein [Clohesyomyces aquaticus]